MTALVLQARLDSLRLEKKCLLPLGGRPMILRVMEALQGLQVDAKILACPDDSVEAFAPLAKEAGFEIVTGPKDDVLVRYCNAIRHCSATRIIRATGDNPFVFSNAAQAVNDEAVSLGADYAGFFCLPYGAGIESVCAKALLRAEQEAQIPWERENVCPYLYGHPEIFKLHRPLAPLKWQGHDMRITVDTEEDYVRAQKLYSSLEKSNESGSEKFGCGESIIEAYRRAGL